MTSGCRILMLVVGLTIGANQVRAVSPPPRKADPSSALSALVGGTAGADLAGNLRAFLLTGMPDPLFEDHKKWGMQKKNPLGKMKNEGRWWKAAVTSRNMRDTLVLDVRDAQNPGPGKTTFSVYVMFDAEVLLEQQTWMMGVRLYSGSTRARVRLRLTLNCEAQSRFEKNGTWIPDAVFRLQVVKADFHYDNLVVEHTAGVSGEAAKVLGDAVVSGMRRWKPSLERKLIEKANAAIVKAGDTKEVRISLLEMMGGKKAAAKSGPPTR